MFIISPFCKKRCLHLIIRCFHTHFECAYMGSLHQAWPIIKKTKIDKEKKRIWNQVIIDTYKLLKPIFILLVIFL